jgi:hypothetical protein
MSGHPSRYSRVVVGSAFRRQCPYGRDQGRSGVAAAHNLTPDQLVAAIRINNQSSPSGNVRIGDKNYITPVNTTIHTVKDFANIPLYTAGCRTFI